MVDAVRVYPEDKN